METLTEQFCQDLAAAEELTLKRWRQRPLQARASELAGQLLRQSF